jgi:hypothetical protein
MMYKNFLLNYESKVSLFNDDSKSLGVFSNIQVNDLFRECGGSVFRNGTYKTHNHASSFYWTSIISELFQDYKSRIIPFGFDWMGRQFSVDTERENNLLMFDPATVEVFEFSQNLYTFHNLELVDDSESYFDEVKFKKALIKSNLSEIGYHECIGYRVPLFLNGKDEIDNLEIVDNEVYWAFQNQIYQQIKNLPPGTKINSIRFE